MSKILITGGSRGIGKTLAKKLALGGHEVIILSRNRNTGLDVVNSIKKENHRALITCMEGDLSSIRSCYKFTNAVITQHPDINVIINNAGVWMTRRNTNENGLEMSFMVNYMAPFIISSELVRSLQHNALSRIISVNAGLYAIGKFDPEKTPFGLDFHPIKTYANSKLCAAMTVVDMAVLLHNSKVTINAVHPGVVRTNLGNSNHFMSMLVRLIKLFWKSPEYAAAIIEWLATSNEVDGVNGKYFNEKKESEFAEQAKDSIQRQRLRDTTQKIINENLKEK